MNKSGSIMTFGKHPVVINLLWPTKGYITLKKQTLMFCQILKHVNFPCVALCIFKKCWWQGYFKGSVTSFFGNICFCSNLKKLAAHMWISKHLGISRIGWTSNFNLWDIYSGGQRTKVGSWIWYFYLVWLSENFSLSEYLVLFVIIISPSQIC